MYRQRQTLHHIISPSNSSLRNHLATESYKKVSFLGFNILTNSAFSILVSNTATSTTDIFFSYAFFAINDACLYPIPLVNEFPLIIDGNFIFDNYNYLVL